MTATATRNGVNVDQLVQTAQAIQATPDLARFQFRSRTTWETGGRSRTIFQGFYGAGQEDTSRAQPLSVVGDEPPVLLGANAGPTAVEAVLHALASCLAVGIIYNAAARGIDVRSLDFELDADLDLRRFLGLSDEVRAGYEAIRVRYRLDSSASDDAVGELVDYVQRTSPVLDIVTQPVPVTVERVQ